MTKKQNFWRILAVGSDNLSVLEEMARNGDSARRIVDVIVNDFGLYGDEIKSGKLKRPTLEQQARRWKNDFLRKQVVVVENPDREVAVREQPKPTRRTAYKSESVQRIAKQVAAQEKVVDELHVQIEQAEKPFEALMFSKQLAQASRTLTSLYSRLTAAENLQRQNDRRLGPSNLYQHDEALQKSIEYEINVVERQQVHELMPEFFRALQWQPGDPDAPPELARELTNEDARTIKLLARKYGLSRNTTRH